MTFRTFLLPTMERVLVIPRPPQRPLVVAGGHVVDIPAILISLLVQPN